ncbi:MAG TPA: glycosyl transferase family 36, partial [Rhodanobacter sp.]|nr:glycosyl transferase family 36 [Rhodanobacter sp.]
MAFSTSHTIDARQHCLLANGNYSVMLDASGSGFSRWHDLAVTRWREDPTGNPWGCYLLLRDEESGAVWAATQQPFGTRTPDDTVDFAPGRASFSRRHHSVHSVLKVAVAADADIELRQLTVSNHGDHTRTLSLTSYEELVLGPIGADNAHPAFSKMFVQTAWDATHALLLATRRRRDDSEAQVWAAHALQVLGRPIDDGCGFETDRARWLGRGRTLRNAQALLPGAKLGSSVGCVLDPIFSLRQHFTLAPRDSVTLLLWTRVADSRDGALALTTQLADGDAAAQLFAAAAQQALDTQRHAGIDAALATRCAHWLRALVSTDATQRAPAAALPAGHGGAPTLWAAGISGDRPIALWCLRDSTELDQVRDLLRAQHYWQQQHFAVDVVLLNRATGTAAETLHAALAPLLDAQHTRLTQ